MSRAAGAGTGELRQVSRRGGTSFHGVATGGRRRCRACVLLQEGDGAAEVP